MVSGKRYGLMVSGKFYLMLLSNGYRTDILL